MLQIDGCKCKYLFKIMDVEVEPDKTNPLVHETTGGDETGVLISMTSTSSRRGSEDISYPFHQKSQEKIHDNN